MVRVESLKGVVRLFYNLLKSDRDVVIGIGGFTGEGKSTLNFALMKEYYELQGQTWDFKLMTWSRKELMLWIDGDKKKEVDPKTGLRPGQLPEYSGVVADELFKMFYRRNWFEDGQIDAIATFNMCRDRHLLVAGNIPNFWDLDTSFTSRVRFYIYVPERGRAWLFEQENNPFGKDPWNVQDNRKVFRKKKNPYTLSNFVCEFHFPDLTDKDKKVYLNIRNIKRLRAIDEDKPERAERYRNVKAQRDELIRLVFKINAKLKNKDLADVTGMSSEAIRLIRIKAL